MRDRTPYHPFVSVLMAVLLPHPRYFREAVQSILDQTFTDFELIIVEDPSTRSARDMLQDFDDPRIVYFANEQRTSLAAQRNRALAEARGELVAIFDADDISEPTRLEKEVAFLLDHPEVDVVGSQLEIIDGEGRLQGSKRYHCDHEGILTAIKRVMPLCQGSALYRKALIEEAGGYRSNEFNACEDYDMLSRLAHAGAQFANLPESLLFYRFHDEQMKASRLRDVIRGVLRVKTIFWKQQMGLVDRVRMFGEWSLLWLPQALVHAILQKIEYGNRRKPVVETRGASAVGVLAEEPGTLLPS
jgi:glycosyltransferase involved in cell wall biosynthesis